MTMVAQEKSSVNGTLFFPKERRSDFVFSNYNPEWRTLDVHPHEVEIFDARQLERPASIHREGFELHHLPVVDPRWEDDLWVQQSYLPLLRDLVLQQTGAAEAVSFPTSWVLRDTRRTDTPPAALYVHMDRERENCRKIVRAHFGDAFVDRFRRFENFNLWRSLTPPPQDYPLAFCDQRTNNPDNWIICQTREPQLKEEMKHLVSFYQDDQKWYYYSNMQPDEVVMFRNYNDDVSGAQGCLHSAFFDQSVKDPVKRASFEFRFYIFYE